jgi:hypothetical protein
MSEPKPRIALTSLPPRPRQLNPNELQNVFGGCYGLVSVCINDSDCCAPLKCYYQGFFAWCDKPEWQKYH